jgi:hypothetical protein
VFATYTNLIVLNYVVDTLNTAIQKDFQSFFACARASLNLHSGRKTARQSPRQSNF